MELPEDQKTELRELGDVFMGEEDAKPYILIKQLKLPDGCVPAQCDVLLCPVKTNDGYYSKLYFEAKIQSPTSPEPNWHGDQTFRILERNWYSFSLQLGEASLKLSPIQLLARHLKHLRVKTQ